MPTMCLALLKGLGTNESLALSELFFAILEGRK